MTLVEVMLSLMVIGTCAMAALSGMLFAFRASDANLRRLGAVAAARSIVEQISTLDYDTLGGTTLPVDLPSSSVGSLTADAWNERRDDIHGTAGNSGDDLVIHLRPEITQSTASTGFACTQVIVRYRWQENSFFATRTREDALTVILSNVNSY